MKINLSHLIAARAAASNEATRYYLCGVQVEATPHGVLCVATDGAALIACRTEATADDGRETWPAAGVIVPSELISRIKLNKHEHIGEISFADGDVTIRYCGNSFSDHAVDGTFPGWRAVMPRILSGETAQLDAVRLAVFVKAAKVLNPKSKACVTVANNGAKAALVSFGDDNECFGVIMPFAAKPPKAVPAWFGLDTGSELAQAA